MSDKPRDDLHYFQWEVSDAKALQKMLHAEKITLAQIGELFLAVMDYVDKVEVEVSPELLFIYTTFTTRIDSKREARVKIGASRAENGQKGGLAKAENAKKKATGPKFTPPTQKQFRDAVEHFIDNGEISEDTTDYDADSFFDKLKDAGWTINGNPIQSRTDWECAIKAKFFEFNIASIRHLYYPVFSAIFADFCIDKEKDGGEWADNATYDFMDTYDENSKCWIVQGESFRAADWKSALTRLMKGYSDSSDT